MEELETEVTQPEVEQETTEPEQSTEADNGTMLDAIQEGLKQEPEESDPEKKEEEEKNPEEETAKEVEETPVDDDEMPPEGISKKAQERFQRLVGRVKEKDAELTELRSNLDGIRSIMQDTGATSEDFSMAFEYLKAMRSNDMDSVGKILQNQIKQYQVATGKQFGQVDPLSEFPELREAVNSFQMSEERAIEMARINTKNREYEQQQQRARQQEQSQHEAAQAKQTALQELTNMGAAWSKTDPDYARKEAIILQHAQDIAKKFPPQQWAEQVNLMYRAISAVQIPKTSTAPAPLRSSGQGGGAKQPQNMLEALQGGLGYSNG